jgi:hypothetical protein
MGYDVHITRRSNWFEDDPPSISLAEWLAYVGNDSEMRLDGYAEAELNDGSVLRTEDPSLAVWIGHPEHGKRDGYAWLWLSAGNVEAKNPDEPTLQKMWAIAQSLQAKVQGDDGEFYDSDGQPVPRDEQPSTPATRSKPWWRIW